MAGKPPSQPLDVADERVQLLSEPHNEQCGCFPHGPDEPCTCDGCWACAGHVVGCTCDIAWDCEHEQRGTSECSHDRVTWWPRGQECDACGVIVRVKQAAASSPVGDDRA